MRKHIIYFLNGIIPILKVLLISILCYLLLIFGFSLLSFLFKYIFITIIATIILIMYIVGRAKTKEKEEKKNKKG